MKNDLTCAVVRDLLPSYAEGLTAPETNQAVEHHLEGCPDCTAYLAAMRAPEAEVPPETTREVDYLKMVKRRGWKRVVLAIFLTLLVLAGGLAAKIFLIGTPASADTMSARIWSEENTLCVEVTSIASGNAWWGWDTEIENGTARITAREVAVSPVHPTAFGSVGIPLEGLREVYLCGRLIWEDGVAIQPQTQALYEVRTPYVGNASAVGKVLRELSRWCGNGVLADYTISLQTSDQPYGMTLQFTDPQKLPAIRQEMYRLTPLILALVDNLEQVNWYCPNADGIIQNYSVTLEELDAVLPRVTASFNAWQGTDGEALESIKDYVASPALFQQLIALCEYGFDSGIGLS